MLKRLRTLRRASDGLAAVEFALILPVLLALVFGAIEVTSALICKTDVTDTASTAADLVAQESSIGDADINNVFSALTALVYPYPVAASQVVISSVIDDGHGGGKVAWSDAYQATPRSVGSSVTVPAGLITTGGSVVMAEVTYTYTSPSTYLIKLPISMQNTFYSHPRRVAQIQRTHP